MTSTSNTQAVLDEIISFVAYDTVTNLTEEERNTLARELGPKWEDQILTPFMQGMTLRSGKVLATGGKRKNAKFPSKLFKTAKGQKGAGCPFGINILARIMLNTLMVYTLWLVFTHPMTIEKGQAAMEHINNFECLVSRNVEPWKRNLCGRYNDFLDLLDNLYYNTIPTIQKLHERYKTYVALGTIPSITTIWITVRWVMKQYNTSTRNAIDVICNMIRNSVDYNSLSADEKQIYQKGFSTNTEETMVRIKRINAIEKYNGTGGTRRTTRKA